MYTKFSETNGNVFLSYAAEDKKSDNYYKILQILKEKTQNKNINSFQVCEDKEELKNFTNLLYIFYNIHHQIVKSTLIKFDFENGYIITENGEKYKVLESNEYTYKIRATQIKAINGIKGFYKFMVECMSDKSAFNSCFFNVIEKL